jgi:DNA-directed RNA polymerase specialized sigma24 family protein
MTDDRSRAEDLVQDALTAVAMRWTRLRETSPDAYARTVIYHGNVSWWRRRRGEVLTAEVVDLPSPARRLNAASWYAAPLPRSRPASGRSWYSATSRT